MKYQINKHQKGNIVQRAIKSDFYNSVPMTAIKMLDPTGISSYGDVYNAWTDGKFDYQDILEPLGALPVVGKLGKAGKFITKGIKGVEDFNAAKKIIEASKFVNSDVIKVGGRTFKKSFNKTFKSPYPYKEFLEAKKVVNGNPVLNYSQYGLKTIGGVDDLLDIKGQGENLINEYNKNPKPLIVKNLKGGILKAQKGLYVEKNDATKVTPKRLTQKAPEVNTTSEMLNGTFNPNAKMGLIPVSPEFMAFTGGVGGLATKATTAAGKIGSAALHGAGQGAMANVSGVGSEQSLSGLATDILGGAIAGGIIKGTPIAANYLKGQYYKHTFDPMKVNLQRYKGLVAPDEVMGIVDKFKLKQLSKKTDKLSKKSAEWDEVEPYEYKKEAIKGQNKLKAASDAIHSPTSQIGKHLGEGGFGNAYQFKYNSDHVVKFGRAAEVDQPLKLPELGKQFANDPNIAIPLRVEQIAPGKYATVMKKMEGVNKFKMNSIPRSSVAEAALKIRALNKSGIGFDYIGDNMLFDPATKKISLIDLNVLPDNYTNADWFTTQVNMAGQNPVTMLKNKLSENLQRKKK